MSKKEALHILMMSPLYFKYSITDRKELLQEFHASVSQNETDERHDCIVGLD